MRPSGRLTKIDHKILRIEQGAMHVDLVKTSRGLLRIGSMPDISKVLAQFDLQPRAVIVPDWVGTQAGDNYTGEEFILWRAQVFGAPKRDYIGKPFNIDTVYRNLDRIFSYFFDERRINIVKLPWLEQWIQKRPRAGTYVSKALKIEFKRENIIVADEGVEVYNALDSRPSNNPEEMIEATLAGLTPDSHPRADVEITVVGNGNGFEGTASSFLLRFGRRVIWVDPCAQPAHSLAKVGVHWDDVTDVFISHNHEDHVLGFSACLKRKIDRNEKLRLITGREIYEVLIKQFERLFPDIDRFIDFFEISQGKTLELDGLKILARLNHHFLPYGSLGIKVTAGGKTWGFSGDTKFDTEINKVLSRPELTEAWFEDCDLIFHEVDFKKPNGVHSYWKEVEKLRHTLQKELLGYHFGDDRNMSFPCVEEGKTYRLA